MRLAERVARSTWSAVALQSLADLGAERLSRPAHDADRGAVDVVAMAHLPDAWETDGVALQSTAARLENASNRRASPPNLGAQRAHFVADSLSGRTSSLVGATVRAVGTTGLVVRGAAPIAHAAPCTAGPAGAAVPGPW